MHGRRVPGFIAALLLVGGAGGAAPAGLIAASRALPVIVEQVMQEPFVLRQAMCF